MSATREIPFVAGAAGSPSEAERAILRTVTYAGLFHFPMTLAQLRRGLMHVPLDLAGVRQRLDAPFLRRRLATTDGFVHPRGCQEWVRLLGERREHTRRLVDRHRRVLRMVAAFPFVRLVALSGGCAHDNAVDDDVDVFLIVKRGRAWAVSLALMVLSKLLGLRRTLCLNYVVDEDALDLPERDLFTGAEIVGMKPLAGRGAYRRFVAANDWAGPLFPNFFASYESEAAALPEAGAPRWLEKILELGGAPFVEAVARRLLGAHLERKARSAPGVVLARHRLKLHTQDHRPRLMGLFSSALAQVEDDA